MSGISLVWKSREFIEDSVLMVVLCRFVSYSLTVPWGNKNVDCQKHQDPWEKKKQYKYLYMGIAIIQHNWNKKTNFPPKRNFQMYGIWILGKIPTLLDPDQIFYLKSYCCSHKNKDFLHERSHYKSWN